MRPPPAAMETYCLPATLYTAGVEKAAAVSSVSQRMEPSVVSWARNFRSGVAPMKMRPDLVTTGPP